MHTTAHIVRAGSFSSTQVTSSYASFLFSIFFVPVIVEIEFFGFRCMILPYSCLNLMIYVLCLICIIRLKEKIPHGGYMTHNNNGYRKLLGK